MAVPVNKIIDLYKSGMSDEAIAVKYGVCRRTIGNWRKRLGIRTKPFGSWCKGKKRPKHAAFMCKYLKNQHPMKGKKHSKATIDKMRQMRNTAEWKAKVFTLERNKNISKSKMGSKNPNWKGGPRTLKETRNRIRQSREYKQWRTAVFKRDNYTCQCCGTRSKQGTVVYLIAHHVDSFANYPLLRCQISNGTTLCKNCHYEVHRKVS